uniref:ATP synthase CF0 B' subunit n=1 Tax=Astrosyne radiata TaxID=1158023 RepID=A0A2U9NT96_9STRA|nr:ATP synthase CF0 B' subunit [Astrosyne radiata]AWT40318.1 ATP synthase CF0 B' subunit [Astrosyne radiata]
MLEFVEGPGGLFDINATLPLMMIQFAILMMVLDSFLYSTIELINFNRKSYILTHTNGFQILLILSEILNSIALKEIKSLNKQSNSLFFAANYIYKFYFTFSSLIYKEDIDVSDYSLLVLCCNLQRIKLFSKLNETSKLIAVVLETFGFDKSFTSSINNFKITN